MTETIRLATPQDAEAILTIYTPVITHTVITFETEPPTLSAMQERVAATLERFPWLVCEREGAVVGYVYASQHRQRSEYPWSVEVAAYVHAQHRRLGIARRLYDALFALLRLQRFHNAYAGITLPNPCSIGLHKAMGFRQVGIYRAAGYKMGTWCDVAWWHLLLSDVNRPPEPPVDLRDLPRDGERDSR